MMTESASIEEDTDPGEVTDGSKITGFTGISQPRSDNAQIRYLEDKIHRQENMARTLPSFTRFKVHQPPKVVDLTAFEIPDFDAVLGAETKLIEQVAS